MGAGGDREDKVMFSLVLAGATLADSSGRCDFNSLTSLLETSARWDISDFLASSSGPGKKK